jgi:hypothetical protein
MIAEYVYQDHEHDDARHGFIDLTWLATTIRPQVTPLPASYVLGKTRIRDKVMKQLGCSAAEAERLVDEMEARGLFRFQRRDGDRIERQPRWRFFTESTAKPALMSAEISTIMF